MRWFAAVLLTATLLLQYRLWVSPEGAREVARLSSAVDSQKANNLELRARNRQLTAEVHDLKRGMLALEERARSELGMIAANETFYQVVPKARTPPGEPRTRTALR